MGETLGLIFGLRSSDGETMKSWVARATELFDRRERKTQVKFLEEARGWILLHRTTLSEEQKAVALARAQGDLRRTAISTGLRSCYPDLVLKNKKVFPAHLVEKEGEHLLEVSPMVKHLRLSSLTSSCFCPSTLLEWRVPRLKPS